MISAARQLFVEADGMARAGRPRRAWSSIAYALREAPDDPLERRARYRGPHGDARHLWSLLWKTHPARQARGRLP
jgi:hypothetical protein